MYTQCPYCQTLFRVRAEQLRLAQGQAHCSRCHGIFNALQHLRESPAYEEEEEWPESLLIDPLDPNPALPPEPPPPGPEEPFGAGEETVPGIVVAFAPEDEELSAEPERHEAEQTRPLYPGEGLDELLPSQSDRPPPIIASPESEPLPFDDSANDRRPKRKGTLFWTLGALLLLAAALLQSAWLTRQQLINYPEGRLVLETLCRYAGCQLPERRAPRQIEVLRRSIISHPTEENALLIQLTLVNRAAFAQPYPQLQIGLYDNNEKLVAQRRFRPPQYLGHSVNKSERLEPNQALNVELAVVDPGSNVTGFKLEFF